METIKVEGPGRRCPYCHDAVEEVAERAACQPCLAAPLLWLLYMAPAKE